MFAARRAVIANANTASCVGRRAGDARCPRRAFACHACYMAWTTPCSRCGRLGVPEAREHTLIMDADVFWLRDVEFIDSTGRVRNTEQPCELGPGLLESAYGACLWHLLTERGLTCQREL